MSGVKGRVIRNGGLTFKYLHNGSTTTPAPSIVTPFSTLTSVNILW